MRERGKGGAFGGGSASKGLLSAKNIDLRNTGNGINRPHVLEPLYNKGILKQCIHLGVCARVCVFSGMGKLLVLHPVHRGI